MLDRSFKILEKLKQIVIKIAVGVFTRWGHGFFSVFYCEMNNRAGTVEPIFNKGRGAEIKSVRWRGNNPLTFLIRVWPS